jgi:programmed cell death 6-interacting protein
VALGPYLARMLKNVLLAVHCKKSKPVDVQEAIHEYVKNTYGPKVRYVKRVACTPGVPWTDHAATRNVNPVMLQAATDVEDDLEEVQTLRDKVIAEANTLYDQRELLLKYYRILSAMESRFPISKSPGHVNVAFLWNDAFK